MEKKSINKKNLKGVVVSDKMQKTVVVSVLTLKRHPRYQRFYKSSKRYKAHDEKDEYHVGDHVLIEETHPISKDKSWKVKSFVQKSKPKGE